MQIIWYYNWSGQEEKIECSCQLSAAAIWDALVRAGFSMISKRP